MNKKRTLFFETKTYLKFINERSTATIKTLMIQKDYEYLVKRI